MKSPPKKVVLLLIILSLNAIMGCGRREPSTPAKDGKKEVKRSRGVGILTDIFVSSPADAPTYEKRSAEDRLGNSYQVVYFKGLMNLEFGMLWAIIEKKKFDFKKHALESLTPQKETWLFRFPEAFVKALAGLTPAAIEKTAETWANIEELQWDPPEAKQVLVELVRLAKLAQAQSKGLYFWGSL